jgi:tRNA threonylcarbamoyladenosine biosynthesis protein TsaB
MIVLGFDTATSATAVAIRLDDGSTLQARDDPAAGAHPGHATRLLELARELLERAGLEWAEIGRIAVGAGPGTFTGLRVGIATARGLAQSLGAELVAVSSPRALAHGALSPGQPGPLLAVIDARRQQVFAAAYGRGGEELLAPRPLSPDALGELPVEAGELQGDPSGWLAVGDGALRYRPLLEGAGLSVPSDDSRLHLISAQAICELGAMIAAPRPLEEIVPDYRRRPDAELALDGVVAGGASNGASSAPAGRLG